MSEVLRIVNEKGCNIFDAGIPPEYLAEIVKFIEEGKISGKLGKELFEEVINTKKRPSEIVKEKKMVQISDIDELEKVVKGVIEAYPDEALRFKNGELKLMGFFVGIVMKETKGKANPKVVNELIKKMLT
jgi:aspartyl-tRNA(Asn)/glutamyl-tRNA(Gln) amidotransferase subunit B